MNTTANVDHQEVERFNQLAARWWDPDGAMQPLHDLNPARCAYVEQWCSLTDQRVVDVGCGGGLLTEAMAARGADAVGIDAGEKMIGVARLHALDSGSGARYECATAEEFAAEHAGQFDLVTCMEMLEHVPAPDSVLRACAALLKPAGWLIASTINRNLKSFGLAIVGAEYVAGLLPRGTHEYGKLIRPSELAAWARAAGLDLVDVAGLHYNPFTREARVGGAPEVNYVAAFRKGA